MNKESPSPFLTRGRLVIAAFFAAFIFLLYQALRLLAPFSSALFWAAILALIFAPVYRRLLLLVKGRPNLAAGIMTTFTVLLVIGPALLLLAALATQTIDLYQKTAEFVRTGKWAEVWSAFKGSVLGGILSHPYFSELNVKDLLVKNLGELSSSAALQIGGMLRNTLLLLLNGLIMLISLFFLFRDGEAYYHALVDILPFPREQKRAISQKLNDTFAAVMQGVFLIALLQGAMTAIGFALFGVPFPVLWGFLAAVAALLPIGGAALIWIAGALYLFFTGESLYGIGLSIWGLLLVSLPDNFLKPLLIGRKTNIPTFFLFLSILGGLKVYGLLGVLFGPIVVTLVAAFIKIYREEYATRS